MTTIDSISPRLQWQIISPEEIERIHEATLTVLERTGVRFPASRALAVLEAGGCRVDWTSQIVRFPRAAVLAALAWAPRQYVLAARDPQQDVLLDGRHAYLSNDASGVFVVDHHTGEVRSSTKADVAASACFVDALPELAFYWGPAVTSRDAPETTRALHDAEAVFLNTSKHFQTVTTVGGNAARSVAEMAVLVAGGRAELRRRPILSFMQCAVDPLGHDALNLEAGLVAAEYGLPCGFMPMPLAAGTGPATLAGTLVVQNAGTLSGLVLLQLAFPGTPVFLSGAPSVIDLQTGAYTGGSPEDYLLAGAATQLARRYEIPMAMGTMATGAKEPGWQAAVDDSLSTFASVMSGADMMNGAGLLNGSKTLSYPHLLMETEIYRIVKRMAAGIDVSDESLALDVIDKVGCGGTYLAESHTRRHARDLWRPSIWDRSPHELWLRSGRPGALEKATEAADEILATHEPRALPEGVRRAMRALVAQADASSTETLP